jgi:hypothetical protein
MTDIDAKDSVIVRLSKTSDYSGEEALARKLARLSSAKKRYCSFLSQQTLEEAAPTLIRTDPFAPLRTPVRVSYAVTDQRASDRATNRVYECIPPVGDNAYPAIVDAAVSAPVLIGLAADGLSNQAAVQLDMPTTGHAETDTMMQQLTGIGNLVTVSTARTLRASNIQEGTAMMCMRTGVATSHLGMVGVGCMLAQHGEAMLAKERNASILEDSLKTDLFVAHTQSAIYESQANRFADVLKANKTKLKKVMTAVADNQEVFKTIVDLVPRITRNIYLIQGINESLTQLCRCLCLTLALLCLPGRT